MARLLLLAELLFQSTRPHGARPTRRARATAITRFQSTRPHGARPDATLVPASGGCAFQSTRPHGARRWPRPMRCICRAVSIHAPARGATVRPRWCWAVEVVSIHAPARGATRAMCCSSPRRCRFNPRARTGRDPASASSMPPHRRFNPRARTGRDGMLITQPYHCKKSFTIANLRALSRKNGKDHDRRSDASTKTTACRNANLRGGQRSLGVRGTRAGAANCVRGTR